MMKGEAGVKAKCGVWTRKSALRGVGSGERGGSLA